VLNRVFFYFSLRCLVERYNFLYHYVQLSLYFSVNFSFFLFLIDRAFQMQCPMISYLFRQSSLIDSWSQVWRCIFILPFTLSWSSKLSNFQPFLFCYQVVVKLFAVWILRFWFSRDRSRREDREFQGWKKACRFRLFWGSRPYLKLAGRKKTSNADFSLLSVDCGSPSKYLFSFSSLVWIIIFEVYTSADGRIQQKLEFWTCVDSSINLKWYFTNTILLIQMNFLGFDTKMRIIYAFIVNIC